MKQQAVEKDPWLQAEPSSPTGGMDLTTWALGLQQWTGRWAVRSWWRCRQRCALPAAATAGIAADRQAAAHSGQPRDARGGGEGSK